MSYYLWVEVVNKKRFLHNRAHISVIIIMIIIMKGEGAQVVSQVPAVVGVDQVVYRYFHAPGPVSLVPPASSP